MVSFGPYSINSVQQDSGLRFRGAVDAEKYMVFLTLLGNNDMKSKMRRGVA